MSSSQLVKDAHGVIRAGVKGGRVYKTKYDITWGGTLWSGFGFDNYFEGWQTNTAVTSPIWLPRSVPNKRTPNHKGSVGVGPSAGVCDKGSARVTKRGRPSKVAKVDLTKSGLGGQITAIRRMVQSSHTEHGMVVPELTDIQAIPVCPRSPKVMKALDILTNL